MNAATGRPPLLEVRDLHLSMTSFEGEAHVLNGIELTVRRGEIWGLVGETGCGKSLTGLSVSQLVPTPPGRFKSGAIRLDGEELLGAGEERMRQLRGRRIGMIFQDPTTNLNPAFRVGDQLVDVALHAAEIDPAIIGLDPGAGKRERRQKARDHATAMLEKVGIVDAAARMDDYPHQFSGGMRQRVLIAMALIGKPDLLIADEPTTALDVSVQAQILGIIVDLVIEYGLGVVLITHNLGVVAQVATHVAVMYAGNIVEAGPVAALFKSPTHPYTRALLEAVPTRHMRRGDLQGLAGVVPDLRTPPPGCRFAPRCAYAEPVCSERRPPLRPVAGVDQQVACVRAETVLAEPVEA